MMPQEAERSLDAHAERQATKLAGPERGENADDFSISRRNWASAHSFKSCEAHREVAITIFLLSKVVAGSQKTAM